VDAPITRCRKASVPSGAVKVSRWLSSSLLALVQRRRTPRPVSMG
jgi:hypothetical protein